MIEELNAKDSNDESISSIGSQHSERINSMHSNSCSSSSSSSCSSNSISSSDIDDNDDSRSMKTKDSMWSSLDESLKSAESSVFGGAAVKWDEDEY